MSPSHLTHVAIHRHAEAVRVAVTRLNDALRAAVTAGLAVDMHLIEGHDLTLAAPVPVVTARVRVEHDAPATRTTTRTVTQVGARVREAPGPIPMAERPAPPLDPNAIGVHTCEACRQPSLRTVEAPDCTFCFTHPGE